VKLVADSFVMYKSYIEAARKFPKDKQLAFYDWIIDYAIYDVEPDFSAEPPEMQFALDVVFGQIKTSITASIKRYEACVENGKKGGRPKGTKNLKNQTENQSKNQCGNQTQNQRHNLNKNYNLNDNSYYSVSEVGVPNGPTSSTHDGKEEKKSEEDLPPYMRGWRPVIE
jgi:hypothetical protein